MEYTLLRQKIVLLLSFICASKVSWAVPWASQAQIPADKFPKNPSMWANKPQAQAVHLRTPEGPSSLPSILLSQEESSQSFLPSAVCLPLNTSRTSSASTQRPGLLTTSQFSSFYPFNTTTEKQSLCSALGSTQAHISRAPLKPLSALLQPLCPPPPNLGTWSWKGGGDAASDQSGSVQQRCLWLLSSAFSKWYSHRLLSPVWLTGEGSSYLPPQSQGTLPCPSLLSASTTLF